MKSYIGCKLVEAEPMKRGEYNNLRGWELPNNENADDDGYIVRYQENYVSWSPKAQFEKHYMEVEKNEDHISNVSIGEKMVDNFISEIHVETLGDKTTLVRAVMVNGFEIIETATCVDPINYNMTIGYEICMKKIQDKLWMLLGFLLQTAYQGVKKNEKE